MLGHVGIIYHELVLGIERLERPCGGLTGVHVFGFEGEL